MLEFFRVFYGVWLIYVFFGFGWMFLGIECVFYLWYIWGLGVYIFFYVFYKQSILIQNCLEDNRLVNDYFF